MCGIVGIADLSGRETADRRVLEGMRDRLTHRGPDDAGSEILAGGRVGLAHRRLAIIAPTAEGHQPMADSARERWIVFNGEIYNYRELRRELERAGHTFRTGSDTEVILEGYRAWHFDVVQHLRGMFAFALWDGPAGQLVLARDRLGIKPLYYAERGSTLIFASEPKALLAHPAVSAEPDRTSLLDYLSFGYVPWDRSAFRGVKKLPPATLLVREGSHTRLLTYWRVEPTLKLRGEEAADAVRSALASAVPAHLVADVPVGAFLSGGVDSSAVVAVAATHQTTPLRTIAVDFDVGESELPYARAVASRYHTDHVEHRAHAGDSLALLDNLSFTYDEPFADTSSVPMYLMCKEAHTDVKVALSGDGGDELFAGYSWYPQSLHASVRGGATLLRVVDRLRGLPRLARLQSLLRRAAPSPLERHRHALALFDPWELSRLAGPALAEQLRDYDPAWLFRQHFRTDLPVLTALQLLDVHTFLLDDILVKVDRASMASSLEVRPPLLDHRLVEVAFSIDSEAMLRDGRGKWPLRRAIADAVPAEVLDRPKRGFSAPMSTWFRTGLADQARQQLRSGVLAKAEIIRPVFVDWMIDNYSERRWAKLWSLLMLERWYARWITR